MLGHILIVIVPKSSFINMVEHTLPPSFQKIEINSPTSYLFEPNKNKHHKKTRRVNDVKNSFREFIKGLWFV